MLKDISGVSKITFAFNGTLNELSASNKVPPEDFIKLENFRLSKDGSRLEKRLGLEDQGLTLAEDIYGYTTYYDSTPTFCKLIVTESKIQRKVGSGAWTTIHTFSSSIVHPQSILEIQGKQYIVNEVDSRFIHTDGNDYQIGITAPASLPTLTAGSGGVFTAGVYRYAVTYARSGNFGNESNPIKSLVGAATFTGSGLNDMTSGGSFTGDDNKTVRVKITTAAATDKIDVSFDGGTTWHLKSIAITTTMYLSYGITLTFGAATGHTLNDYWTFTASACAVTVTADQLVTLTSIPTSSDAQVNQRKIYRTTIGGAEFYWLATLNDNTTTTFVDNIPDAQLGTLMEEDAGVLPNGKFAVWWDNRLWVSGTNIVYYSDIDNPEAFDTTNRYITIRKGDNKDAITGMVEYRDNLYVFKKNFIFVIMKGAGGGYSRYLQNIDMGCAAPWSIVKVNDLLMFLSERGIEVYNGVNTYTTDFSSIVSRTIDTIDPSKYDYICSTHVRSRNEVWWSFADRTGGNSACTLVYNYIAGKPVFYIFSFHKTPSFLGQAEDSALNLKSYLGTRDGYLYLCESGYQDGTTNITATARKGWVSIDEKSDLRRLELEYELPASKTLTSNIYVDFDKDVARTASHTGSTPSSTDIELRRPIFDFAEQGLRPKYFSLEFTNAENLGGDLKINEAIVFIHQRAMKGKITQD